MEISLTKNENGDILRIFQKGYSYSCRYYTQNCWVDDNRLVLLKHKTVPDEDTLRDIDVVLVDLSKKTEKLLVHYENKPTVHSIVYGNTLYYVENSCLLCSLNVDSLERTEIHKSTDPIENLQLTADGRYMNWFFKCQGENTEKSICKRIDLKTGEVVKMLEKEFMPPFYLANHMMISPVDPNILYFAHEGSTTYITNRMWIAPMGKEPYNVAKQRLDENGVLIDCFGHESWSADGKGMYFIKYDVSPEPPKGIGYVDIATKDLKMLFSKYKYWHVCASADGKYLAADIGPNDLDENNMGVSGVCLIDLQRGTETKLATVHNMRSHPGHPHPQFSPSCNKICFQDALCKDTLAVGIIKIK